MREWRKHRHMTQEQAAEALGVEQGTISKAERRDMNITLDFLERLAAIYKIDVSDFLTTNPLKPDQAKQIYSRLRRASPDLQRHAANILEALLKEAS